MGMQSAVKSAEDRQEPLLEPGKYPFRIEAAELTTNKKGTGLFACRFVIREGECEGKTLFQDFILEHEKAYACQLGAAAMRELLNAVGMPEEDDPEALVGASVDGFVEIVPPNNQYPAKNKIVQFIEPELKYPEKKAAAPARKEKPKADLGEAISLDDDDIPF